MSFTAFSKDFTANMFTSVENQFITKYLPQASGDAVRVYLYGLYLCQCKDEFDAESAAKLLKLTPKKLLEIFDFWEECDLVHVLSREPLFVEYLPVSAAVGKPKSFRPEKYAEFNRELYKQLQKAGKDFKPYEMQRILEFLENNPMEQQAFLLVSEYCARKDGEKLTSNHILNKAAQLCRQHKFTYEQVEQELADFNTHEKDLARIFTLLGIYKKPQESDYDFLTKWTDWGMEMRAVIAGAEHLKKGTLATLDRLLLELHEKEIHTESEAREYLNKREELTAVVFSVAKRLGVKVQNPRPYSEEYAEKWLERGYETESLVLLAGLGLKLGYGFAELDTLLETLYRAGIVDGDGVRAYCMERDGELKLLQRIQTVCGVVKKTQSALDMLSAWRSWSFSDEMILEAAKRSVNAGAPLAYMNKLLSEWKRAGAYSPSEIPEKTAVQSAPHTSFKSEAAIAADMRTERERHYAVLREKAVRRVERAQAMAEKDADYREAVAALTRGELELAKAEIYAPETLPEIRARLQAAAEKRAAALKRLRLTERDFTPRYECTKCSDTGFLPDGKMCDCYSSTQTPL